MWTPADSSTLTNDGTLGESLLGQISTLTDGSISWALSPTTNGANQVRAQYSTTSAVGPWSDIPAYAASFSIASAVGVGSNLKLYFRIQLPTSTPSASQFSSTLTVTAQ
jgi:hypothetical protein